MLIGSLIQADHTYPVLGMQAQECLSEIKVTRCVNLWAFWRSARCLPLRVTEATVSTPSKTSSLEAMLLARISFGMSKLLVKVQTSSATQRSSSSFILPSKQAH